jgi:hypothetical protein
MMTEKPKKNQYPAYALKSDDGEIEEHVLKNTGHIYLRTMLHKR